MKICGLKLWEALVILVVLSVIAAILYPTDIGMGRNNVRRSSCQSNMKQIGLGFQQYVQDSNEVLPNAGVVSTMRDDGWMRKLQPYTKSEQLFACPSDPDWKDAKSDASKSNSYYYNRRLSRVDISKIPRTPQTILLGEGEASSSDYNCASFDLCYAGGSRKSVPDAAKLRHFDGANYAFCDGHVKWFKPNRIQSRVISLKTYGFPIR